MSLDQYTYFLEMWRSLPLTSATLQHKKLLLYTLGQKFPLRGIVSISGAVEKK